MNQYQFVFSDSVPLASIVDVVSASVTYICEAAPGADAALPIWRCRKVTTSGSTVTTTTWAGLGKFNQVAANRATLTYA